MNFDGFEALDLDANLESGEGARAALVGPYWMKVRRAGGSNKAYARAMQKKLADYQPLIAKGELPDDVWDRLRMEVFAETIVVAWNFQSGGQPVPFSPQNVLAFFKRYPEGFRIVEQEAASLDAFRRKATDDAAKN